MENIFSSSPKWLWLCQMVCWFDWLIFRQMVHPVTCQVFLESACPFFKHFPRTPSQMVPCNKASGESGYETLSLFKWYPELSWTWGKEFWQQPKLISKHRSHSRKFLASATRASPKVGTHHGKKKMVIHMLIRHFQYFSYACDLLRLLWQIKAPPFPPALPHADF